MWSKAIIYTDQIAKGRIDDPLWGESIVTGGFPSQRACYVESVLCHNVNIYTNRRTNTQRSS